MSNVNKDIHLIGNAHIDPVWLWRWQEGCNEVMQTFRSALDRLKEYDDFVFTCSSAAYYEWVEELDPDMFCEIQKQVELGRWKIVGGWWVQPDCNMPSAESFARQALYSQLYYNEKFGGICRTGYNVDSFGHGAMLPQFLVNSGMNSYVMMRPGTHENNEIPQDLFWWKSPDSSRVLTYRIQSGYAVNGKENLDNALDKLDERIKEKGHGMMLFYGVGNHGGGPTKADIEYLKSKMKLDGGERLCFEDADGYFENMMNNNIDYPVWDKELQHHASGCYSAVSMVKELNRKAENLLANAEKFSTFAHINYKGTDDTARFSEAWKEVCFNQFHDILCGCSIKEAYDEVRDGFGHAMNIASKAYNNAAIRIARSIDTWIDGVSDPVSSEVRHLSSREFPRPLVIFNPLCFEVKQTVTTGYASSCVKDSDGNNVDFQNVRSSRLNDSHMDTCFSATVPPLGYTTYWLTPLHDTGKDREYLIDGAKTLTLENEFLLVKFNEKNGQIASIKNKETGDIYEGAALAEPVVIDDTESDTWAHMVFKFDKVKGAMNFESIELVEKGSVRTVIRTKHRFNQSTLTQDFSLASGQKTVKVKCKTNWQEPHSMLKMRFTLPGSDCVNTSEISGGYIKRDCNGDEQPSLSYTDLTVSDNGKRKGLCVISDSKYSYDCLNNTLGLTCLRNVIFADHYSYRPYGDHLYTDEGLNFFEYGIYVHSEECESSDAAKEALMFNNRPYTVQESYHKGTQAQKKSFITVDADNVVVSAVKLCQDGSGDVIIRLNETKGKKVTRTMVMCPFLDTGFWTDVNAFEMKTFRIGSDLMVKETNFLEGIVVPIPTED